MKSRSKEN